MPAYLGSHIHAAGDVGPSSITIFFNGGLIPTYLLVQRLGIVNTMTGTGL